MSGPSGVGSHTSNLFQSSQTIKASGGGGGFNPNDVVHSFYKGVVNTQTNSLNQSANVQEKLTLIKAPPNDLRNLNFTNGQLTINQNT